MRNCAVSLLLLGSLALAMCSLVAARTGSASLDAATAARQERDRVVSLPGQPSYPSGFRHYSGYVTTDEHLGKALFYWFFEASDKPDEKPLLLRLNGGPGCSSIGFGQSQELGPFLVKKDVPGLEFNPYAWNQGNCQFAVPGFPRRRRILVHEYVLRTRSTGRQFHRWFERFPRYKAKEFYITGESYAGHYIPQLANVIVEENKKATQEHYINFKGFMIGNAYMNYDTDIPGLFDSAWHHALISDKTYNTINTACNLSATVQSPECNAAIAEISKLFNLIDLYSLYTPRCELGYPVFDNSSSNDGSFASLIGFLKKPMGYDPCLQTYATEYFNRKDVQKALHANVTGVPYPYSLCRRSINATWKDSDKTVLPIIKKLVDTGELRVWIFSGDTDGRIPVTSTRYTLNKLGLPIKEDWSPRYNHKQGLADRTLSENIIPNRDPSLRRRIPVGGFTEIYEGLAFVTVTGAGHQVPTTQPDLALELVKHFLANQHLPSKPF